MNERYHRQIILKDFGEGAQNKLSSARVIVIGAGGLGCPILQYLCGAGIGALGIIDDDVVSLENLHRQILYRTADVGKPKVVCARMVLSQLNPEITIKIYHKRLTNQNALEILEDYDVVVDGTDNFATRYLINDACVLLNKPLVYGAISQYQGQLAVFNLSVGNNRSANYRDLFPEPPGEGEILNCEENGVLGVLPGIIGILQANESVKIITGIGDPMVNCVLTYHALKNQFYQIEILSGSVTDSKIPKTKSQFEEFDYEFFCSSGAHIPTCEIDISQMKEFLDREDTEILDIRENGNIRDFHGLPCIKIPFPRLQDEMHRIRGRNVIIVCQAGIKSRSAAKQLSELLGDRKRFYSLQGGIAEWDSQA
jgi:adenylyltransferase/sulfurtransferase